MKNLLSDKRGSLPMLVVVYVLVLLLVGFLVLEMGATYENYDHCIDILQRSCNSAVEANIDNAYRADGILKLNVEGAKTSFRSYAANDLSDRYTMTITSINCTSTPPSMTVIGTITFSTLFEQYDWDDLTFDYKVRATNYDLN